MNGQRLLWSTVLGVLLCTPAFTLASGGGGNWQLLRDARGAKAPVTVPMPGRASFDLEQALRDAKTPAEYEAIAAYYEQAAATARAKAAQTLAQQR